MGEMNIKCNVVNDIEDLISVIVPVFNAEKYLSFCIESLLNQSWKSLEIILIDDGSTDRSADICDSYNIYPQITVFHQENKGVCAARNKGLELARGRYIGFCDNDDTVAPDYYRFMLDGMKQTKAQIVVGGYKRTGRTAQECTGEEDECRFSVMDARTALGHLVRGEYPFKSYLWNKLYDADLFKDLSFPVDRKIEDQFVMYRLFSKASRIAVTKWKGYWYYNTAASITNNSWSKLDIDYLDAWKEIEKFCSVNAPEFRQAARDQVVSAGIYAYSRFRKAKINDKQMEKRLREDILAYSERYHKSTLQTATAKRKMFVWLLRMEALLPGRITEE